MNKNTMMNNVNSNANTNRTVVVKKIALDAEGGWGGCSTTAHMMVKIDHVFNTIELFQIGPNPTWDALCDFLIKDKDILDMMIEVAHRGPRRRNIYWKSNSGMSGRWTSTLYEANPNAPKWAPTAGSRAVLVADVSCFEKVSYFGSPKHGKAIRAEDLIELIIHEVKEIDSWEDALKALVLMRKHGRKIRNHGYGWWRYEKYRSCWENVELISR